MGHQGRDHLMSMTTDDTIIPEPITVNREDITITEEQDFSSGRRISTWTADFHGRVSTGEKVNISRAAGTFEDALYDIENALEDLGWEIV